MISKKNIAILGGSTTSEIKNILSNFSSFSDSLAKADILSTLNKIDAITYKINNGNGSLGKLVNDKELYENLKSASKELDELIDLTKLNGEFDVITMWHVLEHVTELNQTVIELNRLLNTNGKAIIAVPNYKSYDSSFYKKYWAAYDLPIHLYHFSKESISKLFENHGFSLVKTKGMKFDSYYVSMLSEEHKIGKKNIFRAFIIGSLSNCLAFLTKRGYSSTIYVFEKQK